MLLGVQHIHKEQRESKLAMQTSKKDPDHKQQLPSFAGWLFLLLLSILQQIMSEKTAWVVQPFPCTLNFSLQHSHQHLVT